MYDRAGILRGDTISKITSPSFSNNTYDLVDPVYDTADRSPEFEVPIYVCIVIIMLYSLVMRATV